RDTRVATSFSLLFAKSFTTRAAAPGSSFEKASTRGPLSLGPTDSNDVPVSALRASVFFTTRMYTPDFLALERSSVICPTGRPRARLGRHARLGFRRYFGHFRYERLLVFQVECHSSLLSPEDHLKLRIRTPLRPSTVTSTPRGVPRCEKRFPICAGLLIKRAT